MNRFILWLAKIFKWDMPSTDHSITEVPIVVEPKPEPKPEVLKWDTPKQAFHSTRVVCDDMGLSVDEKNLICACIMQESNFDNEAVGDNGTSKDWGLCQINDWFNIGKGKPFPSVAYVIDHPEEVVRWMIKMYKAGKLNLWSSYKFGAYKKWLRPESKMWKLR